MQLRAPARHAQARCSAQSRPELVLELIGVVVRGRRLDVGGAADCYIAGELHPVALGVVVGVERRRPWEHTPIRLQAGRLAHSLKGQCAADRT